MEPPITEFRSTPAFSIFCFYRGIAGATVLKGIAGFGGGSPYALSSVVEISDRLPVKIEFIETRERSTRSGQAGRAGSSG